MKKEDVWNAEINPDAINHASDNLQNDPMLIKASEG